LLGERDPTAGSDTIFSKRREMRLGQCDPEKGRRKSTRRQHKRFQGGSDPAHKGGESLRRESFSTVARVVVAEKNERRVHGEEHESKRTGLVDQPDRFCPCVSNASTECIATLLGRKCACRARSATSDPTPRDVRGGREASAESRVVAAAVRTGVGFGSFGSRGMLELVRTGRDAW